jgi:hypothetical protein
MIAPFLWFLNLNEPDLQSRLGGLLQLKKFLHIETKKFAGKRRPHISPGLGWQVSLVSTRQLNSALGGRTNNGTKENTST